jgi:hypothetical protein
MLMTLTRRPLLYAGMSLIISFYDFSKKTVLDKTPSKGVKHVRLGREEG